MSQVSFICYKLHSTMHNMNSLKMDQTNLKFIFLNLMHYLDIDLLRLAWRLCQSADLFVLLMSYL